MNKIRKVLIVILLCVFVYSSYEYIRIQKEYREVEKQTQDMIDQYDDSTNNDKNPITELKKQNPDTIGWINYDKLDIHQVIMNDRESPEEKEYYLRKDFNEDLFYPGEIYVNQNCRMDDNGNTPCKQAFVYGHAMHNGSRFDALSSLRGQKVFDETDSFTIETENTIKTYQVFAMAIGDTTKHYNNSVFKYYNYSTWDEESFPEIKKGLQSTTRAGSFDDLQVDDDVIVLSTCWNADIRVRLGIYAKLVDTKER